MLIAIDPGNCTGFSYHDRLSGEVLFCGTLDMKSRERKVFIPEIGTYLPDRLIIEEPQVYRPKVSKGDPNDLIKVAWKAGRIVEYMWTTWDTKAIQGKVVQVKPVTWKGDLAKETHHERMWKTLPDKERAIIKLCSTGLNKKDTLDLLDAVCLGKWAVQREVFR